MPDPFLVLAAALFPNGAVPKADADDSMAGATTIPSAVTDARRQGLQVSFIHEGRMSDWYWVLPGGKRVYHP